MSVQHIVRNARAYLGKATHLYDGKPYTLEYPPLIDLETYDRIERRRKIKTLKRRTKFLITGLIKCACGASVRVHNARGKHIAQCVAGCGAMYEPLFSSYLLATMVHRTMAVRAAQEREADDESACDAHEDTLRTQISAVETKLAKLLDLYLEDKVDRSAYTQRYDGLEERKACLLTEMAFAQKTRDAARERNAHERLFRSSIDDVLADLGGPEPADLERKRQVLRDLLQGGFVTAHWGERGTRMRLTDEIGFGFPAFGSSPAVLYPNLRVTEWTRPDPNQPPPEGERYLPTPNVSYFFDPSPRRRRRSKKRVSA